MRESDLDRHLVNEADKSVTAAKSSRDELEESQRAIAMLKDRKPLEFGGKDDFQLAQALNHFKGVPVKLSKTETVEAKDDKQGTGPKAEQKPPELKGSPKK